jgi:hypothetical protein
MSLFEQLPSERLQGRYLRDGGFDARTPVSEPSRAGSRGPMQRVQKQRQRRRRQPRRSSRTGAFQKQRTRPVSEYANRRTPDPREQRVRLGRQALLVGAQLQRRLDTGLGMTPRHDSPRACSHPLIVERQMPILTHSIDQLGQLRNPILASARRTALKPGRRAMPHGAWNGMTCHQTDQSAVRNGALGNPSERDQPVHALKAVAGTFQRDASQPPTRRRTKRSPSSNTLHSMQPILDLSARHVFSHRANDELAERSSQTRSPCAQASGSRGGSSQAAELRVVSRTRSSACGRPCGSPSAA